MRLLYACTIALASSLLFLAEPMAARQLLPLLGGSSVVWLSALAFFQTVLLAGYAYSVPVAAASCTRPLPWLAHATLTGFAAVTLLRPPTLQALTPGLHPQEHTFALLCRSIGLPFFVLSSTTPLLQAWYARREAAAVPYGLFGLSNFASLLALAAYPLLLEPRLTLPAQQRLWRAGFLVYTGLMFVLAARMRQAPASEKAPCPLPEQRSPGKVVLWFALPALASLQLAAVTAHLTEDLAAMPLLWVVPLLAYLLSFVLAFQLPGWYRRGVVVRSLAVLLFALGYFLTETGFNLPLGLSVGFFTAELFLAAWFCHAELYALRPATAVGSTRFYLWLAAGGAAGTLAVVVLSPLLTEANFDLPVSFLLTAVLLLVVEWRSGWPARLLWTAGAIFGLYVLVAVRAASARDALLRVRNFYGSLRVVETQAPPQAFLSRKLLNGAIEHGMEWFSDAYRHQPLTYYTPRSGVGLALDSGLRLKRPRRVGVVGLGAGTLAAYCRPGDHFSFYEINPAVIDVADHLFTFTRNAPGCVSVIPGDARLSLAAEPPQHFDLLAVDAFTGDSIPIHLLTREAMSLYLRHLDPGGIIAFHISNQYLDLSPVVARLAEAASAAGGQPWMARQIASGPDNARGEARATWVLVTQDSELFSRAALRGAQTVGTRTDVPLWTDEYSSVLPILHWRGHP